MSPFPNEWSFLAGAWKFALVLAGREADANALVAGALGAVSKRADLHERERIRRVFFSILSREGAKAAVVGNPETPAERATHFLHRLPEPSRQAITLLCLGIFSGEGLAEFLGKSEPDLARCLDEARAAIKQNPPTTP